MLQATKPPVEISVLAQGDTEAMSTFRLTRWYNNTSAAGACFCSCLQVKAAVLVSKVREVQTENALNGIARGKLI